MRFNKKILFIGPSLENQLTAFDTKIRQMGMICKRILHFEDLETTFLTEDLGKYRFIIINEPFKKGRLSTDENEKFQKLEYFVSLVKKYFPASLSRLVYIRESAANRIVYFPSLRISRQMDEIILKSDNILEDTESEKLKRMIQTLIPETAQK
jgi:hypothetical protein